MGIVASNPFFGKHCKKLVSPLPQFIMRPGAFAESVPTFVAAFLCTGWVWSNRLYHLAGKTHGRQGDRYPRQKVDPLPLQAIEYMGDPQRPERGMEVYFIFKTSNPAGVRRRRGVFANGEFYVEPKQHQKYLLWVWQQVARIKEEYAQMQRATEGGRVI